MKPKAYLSPPTPNAEPYNPNSWVLPGLKIKAIPSPPGAPTLGCPSYLSPRLIHPEKWKSLLTFIFVSREIEPF
ncbi:hypothetical protein BU039_07925 [Staphylococcus simulans]|nr:hypothetical protein BU039_07925 [Staphylococcus simulans]